MRSKKIYTICGRHEQSTGHMAEGYARATGLPGVVLVGSGAALTNTITPLQDALCDGTPMVVVCVDSPYGGRYHKHEDVDVLQLSESCTKWNMKVPNLESLSRTFEQALQIAKNGRPGPVLIYLPTYMTSVIHKLQSRTGIHEQRLSRSKSAILAPLNDTYQKLTKIANLVNIATKPVIFAGQGMMAHPEGRIILKNFADKTSIPVTTSLQGLGAFDETDEKALHMLGLYGTAYANMAVQNADLIIALGARFDDRVTGNITKFAPKAMAAGSQGRGGIVQFDIAPKNVNKVVKAHEFVYGDCATRLSELSSMVKTVPSRPEWFGIDN